MTARPPALIPIVAASRDQADGLRERAEKIVKLSGARRQGKRGAMLPELRIGDIVFEVKSGLREIWCDGSVTRVLAADAKTADGVIPTVAMVDELHSHPDGELYGVLRDGLRAPAPKGTKPTLAGFLTFCELLTLDTRQSVEIFAWQKRIIRAVAQLGSALDWGSRGRRFKSGRPDRADNRRAPCRQEARRLSRRCTIGLTSGKPGGGV